jgi:glycolate oxidase iron-sulfur subunit
MQTSIAVELRNTAAGREADAILRKCVHCGFCNATCPTYQILGDELDGPRGRIYLIKQMMEGEKPDRKINLHLDRCLTCRNCETTCPSGVEYSKLLEIGRGMVSDNVKRGVLEQLGRNSIAFMLRNPALFKFLVFIGRLVRPVLPEMLRNKIPVGVPKSRDPGTGACSDSWPENRHSRKMVALAGCAQSALAPSTNLAAAHVLDKLGISLVEAQRAGCCGAVDLHTTSEDKARQVARQLIDAWWPYAESAKNTGNDFEGFVMTASGCGVTIKEYPHLFRHDPEYIEKARIIAAKTWDLSEVLDQEIRAGFSVQNGSRRVAFHSPCTLQHGQKLTGKVEGILSRVGYSLVTIPDSHLCCGSAGTYSLFQPELSAQLKRNKLNAIATVKPDVVCSANIGCQSHLSVEGGEPVKHWVELLI